MNVFPANFLKIAAAAVLALLLQAGCTGYHRGSLMHPQFHSLAVGTFKNDTEEAALTVQLRSKLADFLMNDGSVKVLSQQDADAVVQGRIVKFKWDRRAASRVSDQAKHNDNQQRDNYQTTTYAVELTVEYELLIPGMHRRVLEKREVLGRAEFTKLSDLDIARTEALKRAAADAAQQIAAGVTEAW